MKYPNKKEQEIQKSIDEVSYQILDRAVNLVHQDNRDKHITTRSEPTENETLARETARNWVNLYLTAYFEDAEIEDLDESDIPF